MEHTQIIADIDEALSQCAFLSDLDDKNILVTGATGMIGSMIVKVLQSYNRRYHTHIHIVAYIRNIEKAESILADYIDSQLEWVVGDICSPIVYDKPVDYIIHTASTTTSKDFVTKPVETIKTTIDGTNAILSFAREQQVQKLVYTSSLEAYGIPDQFEVEENTNGHIDWTNVRSSYSEGKRMAECLCCSYLAEYQVPIIIARLAQTFGAGFAPTDNRVYAQFARAVVQGEDIILHTQGNTIHNYCYLTDAVVALLLLAIKGQTGEIYNIANEETTCSIAEMAQLAAQLSNWKTQVRFDISDTQKYGYNPEVKIKLVSKKLRALGWTPHNTLQQALEKSINWLKP